MITVVNSLKMEGDKTDSVADDKKKKSYAGIPEAQFVGAWLTSCDPGCFYINITAITYTLNQENVTAQDSNDDVDAFMALEENGGDVDKVLRQLDEQHSKYKFMEYNLASKRRRLKSQIPDLENSLNMIKLLQKQSDSPKEIETQFLLSEQVYVKALVPPTDKVCLWLGANVMLEYPLEEAMNLLVKNIDTAKKNLGYVEHDLDFLRDQFTTTEVNMARVYNWDVKKRQAAKASS